MDRFALLSTFIAVAEAESFSEAADRLDLSRAMASKHVQALEDRLGVKLLERTTRRVRLTDAGRRYLERARRLLHDFEVAETEARGERLAPAGLLRINGAGLVLPHPSGGDRRAVSCAAIPTCPWT